jgi:hypothetical protein
VPNPARRWRRRGRARQLVAEDPDVLHHAAVMRRFRLPSPPMRATPPAPQPTGRVPHHTGAARPAAAPARRLRAWGWGSRARPRHILGVRPRAAGRPLFIGQGKGSTAPGQDRTWIATGTDQRFNTSASARAARHRWYGRQTNSPSSCCNSGAARGGVASPPSPAYSSNTLPAASPPPSPRLARIRP